MSSTEKEPYVQRVIPAERLEARVAEIDRAIEVLQKMRVERTVLIALLEKTIKLDRPSRKNDKGGRVQ